MSGIERTGDDSWNFIQSCRIWTDCKKTLSIYFFSELVSGRNPPNLTIWLVPRAGGILRSCPLTRLSMSKNRHFHDDTRDALCPPPEGGKLSLWALSDRQLRHVQEPGHTYPEKESSDGKSLKSSFSLAVMIKSETPMRSIEGKDKLATDPLTVILASLDQFYRIYGALSWNGRLQSPQPSHFCYC